MTVHELLKKLEGVDPAAMVLVPAPDHSYRNCEIRIETALFDKASRTWSEDSGEELTPEAEFGKRYPVVVMR